MRNNLLVGSILTIMLIGGAGCSDNYGDYCCTSNDQCVPTEAEGAHSCPMDTCKCVVVEPITIALVGDWKDPKVGQKNYSVELKAEGGLTPYTWKLTIGDERLNWLALKVDNSDSKKSKAWLTNNAGLSPGAKTEALTIEVTVKDYTKHGEDDKRVDNVGYTFMHPITITDCPQDCINGDDCCPASCNIGNDNDCPVQCGDGVVSTGETCDGNCPTSCDDGDPCTTDTLQNGGTCTAACTHTAITVCQSGDGCCPTSANCNNISDNDCSATCGNGTVEDKETCDSAISTGKVGACPTSCDDGNACTTDTMTGSAANCNAACSHQTITCTGCGTCNPSSGSCEADQSKCPASGSTICTTCTGSAPNISCTYDSTQDADCALGSGCYSAGSCRKQSSQTCSLNSECLSDMCLVLVEFGFCI